ncbi:hypothetical protein ABT160_27945 [Streptomyces sp. NPDC001941]|uniref:hypothetical protein n=1 Tax=Streptomyces sp. NPDC001941 TaxID=3154659 RepID=UPI0033300357
MEKDCKVCQALREEARKPGADLGDLLLQTQLHERDAHRRSRRRGPRPDADRA